ncbi:MAG: hypothetical protein ETSY2_08675 [Candidatus Entotheonella gemina]|uniref:ASPIC/UnbV domain-containing protein n=1 Tax=Candidatus Entotheonella gemina TaxID=1429439 RepID=W4MCG4_9BACT|nr:MAG: hypothetical protein ETSY2_08675 [Candidatus Entotheonella gemina]
MHQTLPAFLYPRLRSEPSILISLKEKPHNVNVRTLVMIAVYLVTLFITRLITSATEPGGSISFQNFAEDNTSGITYQRTPSASFSVFDAFRRDALVNPVALEDFIETPYNPHGQPGVAILDYDNDRDLDIYATNGPGTPIACMPINL